MSTKLIKEIIIMLLLCLVIILLLGILLYEYVPMTKVIPNPVSYTTPNEVKKELAKATTIDENQVIMTYEVDETDLNNYKRVQDYKPGKANPFSNFKTDFNDENNNNNNTSTSEKNQTGVNNNTTSGENNTSNNTNTDNTNSQENNTNNETTTSGGGYLFPDKGTK